jgi:hypothetical protein
VHPYALTHLGDADLRRGLTTLVAQDRATTARLLAHLAEFDARRLYLPAAYPSMYAYCVHELNFSEDVTAKRIQAARVARRFPATFEAVAAGRLHLSAVVLLAPYLTPANAGELLMAAGHKSKSEIEALLAERFPRSETLALVEAQPAAAGRGGNLPSPGQMDGSGQAGVGACGLEHAPGHVEALGAERPGAPACQLPPAQVGTRAKLSPIAPERFRLELTIGRTTHEKLRHAQGLLGHALPSGDLAEVLDRALDALIERLERRKFAVARRPRQRQRASADPRHVPAHVRRAVWERDGGQCTFVSAAGRRCPARRFLEFDHLEPVARGGRATLATIRLRCRAHNQYDAECAFGAGFMRRKREEAQRAAETRRREAARARARAAADEVITPLRLLGFSAGEARRAAASCEAIPDAPLEQRMRRALSYFNTRPRAVAPAATRLQHAP